jgi:thiol-disulfide isomerase/thioredoxin
MKTLMLLSATALSVLAALQDSRPAHKETVRLKPGDAIANFTVKSLDGKEVTLASLRGEKNDKIVVVSFWSHTCPWSRAWDAELSKIAKDYGSKNVVVAAIDSNRPGNSDGKNTDSADDIARYHKENKLEFSVYLDQDFKVVDALGGKATPDVFVVGLDGKIRYTGQVNDMKDPMSPDKFEKNYLRDALDSVIGGKAPSMASTDPKGCSIKRDKRPPAKG